MPTSYFNQPRGFTLVELLVSIGIVLLVTAVAIPSLRTFSRTQTVDNATSQFITVLKRAQSSAANRIRCPNNENATSWQVDLSLTTASDTYALIANCSSGAAQTVLTSPFTSNISTGTALSAVTAVAPNGCGLVGVQGANLIIRFTNQQVTYQCAGGQFQTAMLRITLSDASNNSRTIVIEPGGIIRTE